MFPPFFHNPQYEHRRNRVRALKCALFLLRRTDIVATNVGPPSGSGRLAFDEFHL
ncbi:hypothetical protein RKLH11_3653 [Rhodobacteraceae bacterium KLH11]|nr:hypothetical protein RKLH11_3653 [Rhodobacteraceae bacterium KLH11]